MNRVLFKRKEYVGIEIVERRKVGGEATSALSECQVESPFCKLEYVVYEGE